MATKKFCDNCTKEIVDGNSDFVEFKNVLGCESLTFYVTGIKTEIKKSGKEEYAQGVKLSDLCRKCSIEFLRECLRQSNDQNPLF